MNFNENAVWKVVVPPPTTYGGDLYYLKKSVSSVGFSGISGNISMSNLLEAILRTPQ